MFSLPKPALSLAAVAVAMLAGCGPNSVAKPADPAPPTPLETVLAAADRSAQAETAKFTLSMSVAGAPGVPAFTLTGDGAVDATTGRMIANITLPPINGVELGTVRTVVDGDVMYQELPAVVRDMSDGVNWVKIDLSARAEDTGMDIQALMKGQALDPRDGLKLLKAAAGDVTVVGSEAVRGAQATRYTVRADFAEAAARETDPTLKRELEVLDALFAGEVAVIDAWIDGDGRVVRMSYTAKVPTKHFDPSSADGGTVSMTTTVETFDFGSPVVVTVPPASEVIDEKTLTNALS